MNTKTPRTALHGGATRREAFVASAATFAALSIGDAAAQASRPVSNSAGLTTPADAQARTSAGAVRGFKRNGIYIFKGMPYGADTSGANRFMPPRPAAHWDGVRLSLVYGPACPQATGGGPGFGEERAFVNDGNLSAYSEDCLRLNVWSPQLGGDGRMPVMVWLHGGGFVAGSGHEVPSYDGENLAKQGVVIVTLNHRLGPLGFMNLAAWGAGEIARSANVGMLDIVLALGWVRDNIAQFGGDPARVTIFGQSGGGGKVSTLMAMPAARGLFHRAIVMSGSFPAAARQSDALAAATIAELGVPPGDIAALQAIEPARLIAAAGVASRRLSEAAGGGAPGFGISFGPHVDGAVLPEAWETRAPAISANIPMIIGNTRDEFRPIPMSFTEATLVNAVPPHRRERAPQIVAALRTAYPALPPTEIGAMLSAFPMRLLALAQAEKKRALRRGAPVFCYWYTWCSPILDGQIGAPHGADIPPAFDNTQRCDTFTGNTPEVREIARLMSGAFVQFAATGDPSQPGLAWPAFDSRAVQTMIFDTPVRIENDPAQAARRLLA